MNRFVTFCFLAVASTVSGLTHPLLGQSASPDTSQVALVHGHDVAVALGVAVITSGTMAFDERLARSFQRAPVQSNGALKGGSGVFNILGFPGSAVVTAGAYFYGLSAHSTRAAALGMHTGEAIVLGGVLAEALQMSIGRARPEHDIRDAHDFRTGKGFSDDDYTSFPSAHVTVAFAAATAASREAHRSWPGAARYLTPAAYTLAGLVGASRMFENKHWASDVVGAAGLGTYSAVLFDRYNQSHPNNWFERALLPVSIVPERGGVAIAWSVAK